MNKKIKIIELLQDFADEKEIVMPQYVRYLDRNTNEKAIMLVCQENIIDKLDKKMIKLNDYVEILEDNTEDIEELEIDDNGFIHTSKGAWKGRKMDIVFAESLNQLAKAVKQLDKKIKEK